MSGRRPQGIAYFREGVRLATQAGDTFALEERCSTCRTR